MKKIIANLKYKFLTLLVPKIIRTRPENITVPKDAKTFYDFQLQSIEGKNINFDIYKGKKVLVVNIASQCGFTPQYQEIEELYQKHKDKLVILGFPSNDFGRQERGSNEEIATFCKRNFSLTFQLFQKSSVVKGAEQNPLYQWLSDKNKNGWNSKTPNWNFCKYLINEKGELINFFSPSVNPLSEEVIKHL
jgi:glutathione peroxidase